MAIVTKEARVHLRVTPLQAALWKALADEDGLALSEWLRRLADRQATERVRGTETAPGR